MRKPMAQKIALLYPASVPWFARCLDGIRRYAREHGHWHLVSSPPTLTGAEESALTLRAMQGWKGDAMIIASNSRAELQRARAMRIPIINLAGGLPTSHGIPRVMVNHFLAGRMAADHLLERGLRHLAFFGWNRLWYSDQRRRGFLERAAQAGAASEAYLLDPGTKPNLSWRQRIAGPARWLASLPQPCGIFAVHDYRAQFLLEACGEAARRVPEDIALIGMDDDETICEHSAPKITSVSRNSEQVGWEALALLDRMLRGERPPARDLLVDPDGVVTRQSTDMLYCADPLVRRAIDLVRADFKIQLNVATLAECLGVSKRTLETRFREAAGSSPHGFITKLRVQQAKVLLASSPRRTIEEIALACGFGTPATAYAAFQRVTGKSPATFRKTARSGPGRRWLSMAPRGEI
ncbi:MAG TPA: DNA-binding transcriptional regulator [Opitutales bacterium]|nr:DNA-binding transcriptional regulator [Opitutales bacterium]